MKKFLLAATAIVGVAILSQPALAEVKTSVGGYMEFTAGVFDNNADWSSKRDFQTEAEVDFRAVGKTDSGLEYSAEIQLRNDGGSWPGEENLLGVDEAYLTFAGNWGKVEMGDTDGAVRNMAVFAPVIGYHQVDFASDEGGSNFSDYLMHPYTGVRPGERFESMTDATKISYYTPKWNGFQAGASYTPELFDQGQSVITSELLSAGHYYDNAWEAAIVYSNKFDEVGVTLGATIITADAKPTVIFMPTLFEDFTAWSVGAQVSWKGFTVGGAYVDNDHAFGYDSSYESDGYNLGISYETGDWAFAASWLTSDFDSIDYSDDHDVYGIGAIYKLAPGLVLKGDLMFMDEELTFTGMPTTNIDGWVLLLGTRMTF